MYRDKYYVRTQRDLLFNVTGYRHPEFHVYASLKYVRGEKWTLGYAAAREYLAREFPEFAARYIRVPLNQISEVYSPLRRWQQLQSSSHVSPLHREALDLGSRLQDLLEIPNTADACGKPNFGITDSLLWSDGHPDSDIDLVVMGRDNASQILRDGDAVLRSAGFEQADPDVTRAPYGLDVEAWPQWIDRKVHIGRFRGRPFSLRAIKSRRDLAEEPVQLPRVFRDDATEPSERRVIEFEIHDAADSLFFPAVYRNPSGHELIDYSVVYEGVFRAGDVVRCPCKVETVDRVGHARSRVGAATVRYTQQVVRYVIDGACEFVGAHDDPSAA